MAIVQGGTYSLLGINAESVPTMQQAIKDYKEGIVTPLDDLVTQSDYTSAFKGSVVAEKIGGYIGTVIGKLKEMIDVIDDFDASLTQVQINYEDQAGKISSDVVADAENIEEKLPETTPGVQGYTSTNPGPTGPVGPLPGPNPGPTSRSGDYDFNQNGVDTGRIASNEADAVAGNFIPEDKVYEPAFEADGVHFHEGPNGGYKIESADGTGIGWTDVTG